MTTADFDYVRQFVRSEAGIIVEPGKEYLVESRLQTLAHKDKFASVDVLVATLRAHLRSELHRKVVDAMTTNETSFFRDIHPFEALKKTILPDLIKQHATDRQLNIWCGAASTGQECFSVLMMLSEHFPELLRWNLSYVATDICLDALARAKAGRFTQLEVNRGLPAALLMKYFTRQGAEWEFRDDLRRRVDFREMNLVKDWPRMPPMDVILLRNVLIYFDVEAKKSILGKVRRLLRPGGYLLLGGAETTLNLDAGFERVALEKTTCYRLKAA